MWQEAYPEMTATVETQEWRVYLDTTRASTPIEQTPNVFRFGWCGDYPHADNWMRQVWHPEAGSNRIRLSTDDPEIGDLVAEYMEVTEAAQVAADADAPALYKRAEELLNDEFAGIAPIYYYATNVLQRDWLDRSYDQIKLHLFQWTIDQEAQQAAMQ
jgi:oligopeptide transport system substrate-binding protein